METGWHDGLPDLNQDNEATREYLLDAAKWWITETDIDGYRLNKVQYVGKDFWKEFVDAVKSEKSNFYTIGDVNGDADTISSYKETGMDAFMAYPQNGALREAFSAPDKELKPVFNAFEDSEAKFGGKAPKHCSWIPRVCRVLPRMQPIIMKIRVPDGKWRCPIFIRCRECQSYFMAPKLL